MRGCGCPYHGGSGWPYGATLGGRTTSGVISGHYHRARSGPGPVPRPAFKAGGAVRSRLEGSTPSPLRAGGTLDGVSAALTSEKVTALIGKVVQDGQDIPSVARTFLRGNRLI